MKRLAFTTLIIAALSLLPSCGGDDTTTQLYNAYQEWAEKNEAWLIEQQALTNDDGTPYFETVVPSWNPAAYVLVHYYNDRAETAGNLSPLSTSTIDTRYILHYYNGTAIDSSYTQTTYGPGIFRTQLSSVITGWTIAFETMHVGDTCEIVIPYQWAYGTTSTSILPYSNLKFNVRLVDIPYYEKSPE